MLTAAKLSEKNIFSSSEEKAKSKIEDLLASDKAILNKAAGIDLEWTPISYPLLLGSKYMESEETVNKLVAKITAECKLPAGVVKVHKSSSNKGYQVKVKMVPFGKAVGLEPKEEYLDMIGVTERVEGDDSRVLRYSSDKKNIFLMVPDNMLYERISKINIIAEIGKGKLLDPKSMDCLACIFSVQALDERIKHPKKKHC